jgi:hypothetical protein
LWSSTSRILFIRILLCQTRAYSCALERYLLRLL